jgi:hypothetical protein
VQEYPSDGGAHGAMRGDFCPDYDQDAQDLDMHINILSRMVAQSVDWRGVIMRCQLRLVFGNDIAMRNNFISAWEERAWEVSRSILRVLFAGSRDNMNIL